MIRVLDWNWTANAATRKPIQQIIEMTNGTPRQRSRLLQAAADLFPGYFALVMATGIVSIATQMLGMRTVAVTLLVINVVAYAVLWLLLLLRLVLFFPRIKADITDHVRGPGFFTVVAATCILGSQFIIVAGRDVAAAGLWLAAVVFWILIMYTFFTAVTVRENKPTLEGGLNGSWLIAVVATQSISVLGTLLATRWEPYHEAV